MGVSPKRLAAESRAKAVLVTDQEKREGFAQLATTIALPSSYGRLREALVKPLTELDADEAGASGRRASWISKISRRQHVRAPGASKE